MIYIWEELNRFKGNRTDMRIKEVYNRFPETRCLGCGKCCWDTPEVTYVEFLYAFDFFINQKHNRSEIIDLYKKIYRYYMYEPIQDVPCVFLTCENKCSIHSASPLSCKRWGLQSFDDYKLDLECAYDEENYRIDYFDIHGIKVNRKKTTEYCNNVRITKYGNHDINQFLTESSQTIRSIDQYFSTEKRRGYNIHNYFLAAFFNESRLPNDRIRQLKKYQLGDKQAIDTFIESIDFEAKLEKLLSKI